MRALVAQRLIDNNTWLVPTLPLMEAPYIKKPPLHPWLAAGAALLFNKGTVSPGCTRLPSILAGLLLMFIVFSVMKNTWGTRHALLSLTCMLCCPLFLDDLFKSDLDMLNTAFTAGSVFVLYYGIYGSPRSRYRIFTLSYVLLGLSVLAKGYVGPLYFLIIASIIAFDPAGRTRLVSFFKNVAGILLFALIALPWYLYIGVHHFTHIKSVIFEDLIVKIYAKASAVKKGSKPFYFYFERIIAAGFPWTVLALIFIVSKCKGKNRLFHDRSSFFLLAWLIPVLVLSFADSKHLRYILPAWPFFAAYTGVLIAETAQKNSTHRPTAITLNCIYTTAGLLLASVPLGLRIFAGYHCGFLMTASFAAAAGALVIYYAWQGKQDIVPKTLFLGMLILFIYLSQIVFMRFAIENTSLAYLRSPLKTSAFINAVETKPPLIYYAFRNYPLMYNTRTESLYADSPESLKTALKKHPGALVVCRERSLEELKPLKLNLLFSEPHCSGKPRRRLYILGNRQNLNHIDIRKISA